jgi:hypothetical protein
MLWYDFRRACWRFHAAHVLLQDIKTTRSIIANGKFYEVIPIALAIMHHLQFAIPYSGTI